MATRHSKIGRRIPYSWRKAVEQNLIWAGMNDEPDHWIGKKILDSIAFGLVVNLVLFLFGYNTFYLLLLEFILFTAFAFVVQYLMLILKADKRAKQIEEVLPSALQLISANIRAGMTPDKAIWMSARDEFFALKVEIQKIASETTAGIPLAKAFLNMSKRVKSSILDRTVRLIIEGLESGGEIAKLLDETRSEIDAISLLRKEAVANVSMYVLFITFASLLGAPVLFGVSTFFVIVLTQMTANLGIGDLGTSAAASGVSMLGSGGGLAVSPEFLMRFSIMAIVIITFFAALIVGLIKTGDEKQGLKYAPIYIGAGLTIFWIVKSIVSSSFGSVFLS